MFVGGVENHFRCSKCFSCMWRYTFFSSIYYSEILNLFLRKQSLERFGSILVSPVCWVCGTRMSALVVLTWRRSRWGWLLRGESGCVGLRCGRSWKEHSDNPAWLLSHRGTTLIHGPWVITSLFNHRCLGKHGLGYIPLNCFVFNSVS